MKKLVSFLSLLSLLAVTGCLGGLLDHLSAPVSGSPEAWVPRVEGGDGFDPIDASSTVTTRLLANKDSVVINMTSALRPQPRVEDVVDEEGNITLPILGEFAVAGLTTADAERAIRKAYLDKQVYKDLTVNVVCTSVDPDEGRFYSITGAVARRGRCVLTTGLTLRQAIIAAGDATDFASGKINITRNGRTKSFSYRRIRKGLEPDPVIFNGDIIEVCQ